MANRNLFQRTSIQAPVADAVNEAGGQAYKLTDEAALVQYAMTGTFNGTFYASPEVQLASVLKMAEKVTPAFIAKLAVYSHRQGYMKDVPAMFLAILSNRDIQLTKKVFPVVCDNAKMVKNFVQIIRSGQTGRKSFGTAIKKLIQNWLNTRNDWQLSNAVVGQDPSLSDIIKLVHPKPPTPARAAFYKYLIGRDLTTGEYALLPTNVIHYEDFKKGHRQEEVPAVPFMLLTNLKLNKTQYQEVARGMSWSALRQNLNALARHEVFDGPITDHLAKVLANPENVLKARAFPFQLYSAFRATQGNHAIPAKITNALQDAMEISLTNIPGIEGPTFVAIDVSGSMAHAVTGDRGIATTSVRCVDAAAVMGSAILRKNPNNTEIIPFNTNPVLTNGFNSRDSVMTNAQKLGNLVGGGTSCASVLIELNRRGVKGTTAVVCISDNQSWVESMNAPYGQGTEMMRQWNLFRRNNPKAKLVCIDIQPITTTQVQDRQDVLNISGYSDQVFDLIGLFLKNELSPNHFVGVINQVEI